MKVVSESFYFCLYWNLPRLLWTGDTVHHLLVEQSGIVIYPWNFKLQYKKKVILCKYDCLLLHGFSEALLFVVTGILPRLLWTGDIVNHLVVRICNKSWFNRGVLRQKWEDSRWSYSYWHLAVLPCIWVLHQHKTTAASPSTLWVSWPLQLPPKSQPA